MKIRTNAIDVNHAIDGEGPWVTFSNSLTTDLHMWDEEARRLSKNYKVLRYDTRGHGATSAPPGPYNHDMLVADLHGLFEALGVTSTHFVGLSMGGMIGQAYALKHPGRFKSLVLCDTSSRYGPEVAEARLKLIKTVETEGMAAVLEYTLKRYFTEACRKARPDVIKKFADMILGTPVAGYVGCTYANMRINLTEQLKAIRCPTLVIVGEHDPGTNVTMAREIQGAIAGAELVIIRSAAHMANAEQPDAFNQALGDFLAKVDKTAR